MGKFKEGDRIIISRDSSNFWIRGLKGTIETVLDDGPGSPYQHHCKVRLEDGDHSYVPEKEMKLYKNNNIIRWSQEQLDTLRRLYPNTPLCDIAEQTGKTIAAVIKKARLLGLKKDPDYDPHAFIGRYTKKGRYAINRD